MKLIFGFTFLVLLSACGASSRADNVANINSNAVNSSSSYSNSNQSNSNVAEETAVNNTASLNDQNEKFRVVPENFTAVDFKNYTFPTENMKGKIEMKNGEFLYEDRKECDNHFGQLQDVFYFDLKGDDSKAAFVIINDVACGCGSCDGGSKFFYIFDLVKNKPKLIWSYQTGNLAYGDGLKFLSLKSKQIAIELFQKLSEEEIKENPVNPIKFRAKNIRQEIYSYNGKTFTLQYEKKISAEERNVMNYRAEIVIE